jgi:hypothetical protein
LSESSFINLQIYYKLSFNNCIQQNDRDYQRLGNHGWRLLRASGQVTSGYPLGNTLTEQLVIVGEVSTHLDKVTAAIELYADIGIRGRL